MRLFLLRHGQTHGNTAGALDTAVPGEDLTPLGVAQARAAARVLADQPIEAIYDSTLVRTHQTAAPLADALGIVPKVLDGLREISAGDYEMRSDAEAGGAFITVVADWIDQRLDTRMPGGEDGHEFLARYDAAVAEIAGSGHDCALVVSHGAAIRTWVSQRVTGSEGHDMAEMYFHNTGAIELDGDPEAGWRILGWSPDPIGGDYLDDETAPDPTGQPTEHGTEQGTD
jgi:probable phosphoglycerate mutase